MPSREFQLALRELRPLIKLPPTKAEQPILIILSGLPGTGKSTVAEHLGRALPAVIIQSDFVRKTLFPNPTYTSEESRLVHAVSRALIREYLKKRYTVVCDATNLIEFHRQLLIRVAQSAQVPVLVVQTTAPERVIRARLRKRFVRRPEWDISDATWKVYRSMSGWAQPIRKPYLRVDTTNDRDQIVKRIVRAARRLGKRASLASKMPHRTS